MIRTGILLLFFLALLIGCAVDGGNDNTVVIPTAPGSAFINAEAAQIQIDRIGRPATTLLLIPTDLRETFKKGKPDADIRFRERLLPVLQNYGKGNTNPETLVSQFLPDVILVDTAFPSDFAGGNGRKPANDCVDTQLRKLTGNSAATDGVPENDLAFTAGFPYLPRPHSPPGG